jgi:hypothetical protein
LLEGAREDPLGPEGQVVVGVEDEKFVKGVQVFELVSVENAAALFFGIPEFDLVVDCELFKAIDVPVVSEEGFGVVDVFSEVLTDPAKAG